MRAMPGSIARLKAQLQNVALLVGALLFCFVAFELGLRVYYGNPPVYRYPQVRHIQTPYGYKPEPKQRDTYSTDQPVVTNVFGFRDDRDWVVPRPAGVLRVMVLGDSLTFGNAEAFENIYSKVLERRLNRTLGSIEVVNVSAGGWNTGNEVAFFLQEGRQYDPSILVLGFYPNDWVSPPRPDASATPVELSPDARVEGRPPWLRWLPYSAIYFLKRSATVMYLRDRLAVATSSGPDFVSKLLLNKVDLNKNPAVAYTLSELLRLKQACDERGIPVVIASIPPVNLFWLPKRPVGYVEHLRRFSEVYGISFVDLAKEFWEAGDWRRLYMYPWDNHLSVEGHRLVAAQLEPVIAHLAAGARPGTSTAAVSR